MNNSTITYWDPVTEDRPPTHWAITQLVTSSGEIVQTRIVDVWVESTLMGDPNIWIRWSWTTGGMFGSSRGKCEIQIRDAGECQSARVESLSLKKMMFIWDAAIKVIRDPRTKKNALSHWLDLVYL